MIGYLDDNFVEEASYVYEDIDEEINKATNILIKNVLGELNYEIKDYDERKVIVENIYKVYGNAINERFSFYQDSNLNKYINKLYYDKITNMFNTINNYLLFADSHLERSEYKFYKSDDFKDGGGSEISLEVVLKNELRFGDSIDKQVKKFYDEYNHASYSIELLKDEIEKCEYAKSYIDYNKLARDIIENPQNYNYTEQQIKILKKAIGYRKNNSIELDKDVISVIKAYKGYIYLKSPLKESEEIDWDYFDYDNKDQVLALLRFNGEGNFDTDLGMLIYEFSKIMRKTYFTEVEKHIIRLWKNDVSQTDISKELGVTVQYINSCLNKIASKVAKTYWDDYEEWYYTYKVKGHYKKCSRCNQTKLIKEFGDDSRNKDLKKGYCRDCDRKS